MLAGTKVKAFHPRTLGVAHSGMIVRTKKVDGIAYSYKVDFTPLIYKGKSEFWISRLDIIEAGLK